MRGVIRKGRGKATARRRRRVLVVSGMALVIRMAQTAMAAAVAAAMVAPMMIVALPAMVALPTMVALPAMVVLPAIVVLPAMVVLPALVVLPVMVASTMVAAVVAAATVLVVHCLSDARSGDARSGVELRLPELAALDRFQLPHQPRALQQFPAAAKRVGNQSEEAASADTFRIILIIVRNSCNIYC